ncbi:MAG: GntR family transcriptional regulator [Egibacteraceae bacterium]
MTDLSTGGVAKYHRLASELRRQIEAGVYRPGDQLPSESQLTERFGVSQPTVRAAVRVLRAEGLVVAVHGRGIFVRERRRLRRVSRNRYGRARGDQQLLTAHLRHEITWAGRAPAPEDIAELMGIQPGDDVIVRRRTLYDRDTDKPTELGASYLPLAIAAGTYLEEPEVVGKALFLCVEELTGRRYRKARDRFTARMPTVEEAVTLGIGPATPVISVVHAAFDDDDEVLEVSESVWAADRVMIVDDYDIPGEPVTPQVSSEL